MATTTPDLARRARRLAYATIGITVLSGLGGAALATTLAFGTVVLLYLVTEELLAEAHETPDTPILTAMFFVGFLTLLTITIAT